MDKIAFVIQVRTGSTRLAHKMVKKFWNNKSIPEIIIEKLRNNFPDIKIILATTDKIEDLFFRNVANFYEIDFFQGNETDVLKRFIDAAEYYSVQKIIRICADNPFLDMKQMEYLTDNIDDENDYISFNINGVPSIKTHFGFWAEYVRLDALKKIQVSTKDILYLEHVTNFIYTHPELFKINFLDPNQRIKDAENIRMTIDTAADFDTAQQIYKQLNNQYAENFGIDEILNFLDTHSDYKIKMTEQIRKNTK